jgi:hypothetical protein
MIDFSADVTAIVTSGEFAESATYKPLGGSPIVCSVIVDRHPPSRITEASVGLNPGSWEVLLPQSVVATINTGRDKINLLDRPGGTLVDKIVGTIQDSSGGLWKLTVE